MSRINRKVQRDGRMAFSNCDVKAAQITRFFQYDDENMGTGVLVAESELDTSKPNHFNGYRARLDCPRTQDDPRLVIESPYRNHATQIEAVDALVPLAASLVCRDCMYSNMTPVQVSIARKEFETAEIARLEVHSELERAKAVMAEIEQSASVNLSSPTA